MSGKEINNPLVSEEAASNKSSDNLINAAEAYADEQIMDLKEKQNNRKRTLMKLGAMGVITVIILVFATIAWFTQNREVSSGSMAITTATMPFDIATSGSVVRNKDEFEIVRNNYTEGYASGNYHTSQNTDSLMLRFTPVADDPETETIDESKTPDIGPNSTGELNLYIIPKKDGPIDAYINLDIISFKTVTVDNEVEFIEINDELTTSQYLTAEQIADCKEAAEYLKGHIMFFEGLSSSPASYSYVTPVTNNIIHFHQDNAVKDTPYKVPIYWTWPNTLGQIALKTNVDLLDGIPVVQMTPDMGTETNRTDKYKVLSYLKSKKDSVFKDLDLISGLTAAQKAVYDALETDEQKAAYLEANTDVDSWIENADTVKYFDLLSEGYNTADFTIGTNLNYFLIEVTVKESGSNE